MYKSLCEFICMVAYHDIDFKFFLHVVPAGTRYLDTKGQEKSCSPLHSVQTLPCYR
jgi:hypothetical protein